MKFDPFTSLEKRMDARDERRLAKRNRLAKWHFWFAWRPVVIDYPTCAWLETIARIKQDGDWKYGPITNVLKE